MNKNGLYEATAESLERMSKHYKSDERPWIIPFSGDQWSLALVEMLFDMLEELPEAERKKPVVIVSAQTGIDFPHLPLKWRAR